MSSKVVIFIEIMHLFLKSSFYKWLKPGSGTLGVLHIYVSVLCNVIFYNKYICRESCESGDRAGGKDGGPLRKSAKLLKKTEEKNYKDKRDFFPLKGLIAVLWI